MSETPKGPDETAADAAFFGLLLDDDAEREPAHTECEVWAENLPALELFLRLSTQWRHDPMSGMTLGLDYPAVAALLSFSSATDANQVFRDLQVMELAALGVLNQARAKQSQARPRAR